MGRCLEFTCLCNWNLIPAGKFHFPSPKPPGTTILFSPSTKLTPRDTSCRWNHTTPPSSMAKLLHTAECLPCWYMIGFPSRIYLTQVSVSFGERQRERAGREETTIVTDSLVDSFWVLVGACPQPGMWKGRSPGAHRWSRCSLGLLLTPGIRAGKPVCKFIETTLLCCAILLYHVAMYGFTPESLYRHRSYASDTYTVCSYLPVTWLELSPNSPVPKSSPNLVFVLNTHPGDSLVPSSHIPEVFTKWMEGRLKYTPFHIFELYWHLISIK